MLSGYNINHLRPLLPADLDDCKRRDRTTPRLCCNTCKQNSGEFREMGKKRQSALYPSQKNYQNQRRPKTNLPVLGLPEQKRAASNPTTLSHLFLDEWHIDTHHFYYSSRSLASSQNELGEKSFCGLTRRETQDAPDPLRQGEVDPRSHDPLLQIRNERGK